MTSPLYWALLIVIALWQVELAVHSGIAASRRPAPPKASATTNTASAPVCTGTLCRPSPQPLPQRVITSPR